MYLIRLVRLPNLLLIAFAQCIVRFGLIAPFEADITLSSLGFTFIVLATVLIAAGGYIINDVYDINADKINRPHTRVVGVHIKEQQAKLLYFVLTFSGVGLGFVLSNMIGIPIYFLYFLVTALLLYAYARRLKRMGVIGNILVSVLVGLAIIIVGIFELFPAMTPANEFDQMFVFYIIQQLAFFAFYMTLIRELVKDIQDIQGDHVARYKTLPILLGAARTAKITAVLVLVLLTLVAWYVFSYLHDYKLAAAVILFSVVAPLGYVAMQLNEASTAKHYKNISLFLKVIMFIGICTIPLISYMLQNAS